MNLICSWCNKQLDGVGKASPELDGLTSHGICLDCANKFYSQQGISLDAFLEKLDVPVALFDADLVIYSCNRKALDLINKPFQDVQKGRFGEVFDCVHSKLNGCGKGVCCSACVIRKSVKTTHATGEKCVRVPAMLKYQSDQENPVTIDFFISTFKSGDIVLLRIDPVDKDKPENGNI